ncbi:MAG TPA: MMPL family transporter [Streptosporangiaceae bacterium]|jgi:RND superfamily putative drug exporter|nr:MMPL family transporter [Streptosporangiaceae bacterium]
MRVDAIYGAIGRFSVRFRWLILLIWIAGAIAASTQLPSLSSVTQGNNQKFLPANAPSSQAADLAAPFGTANKQPIPVVVATTSGKLTAADTAAISGLEARLAAAPDIAKVVNAGRSADGQAVQLVALASVAGSGNPTYAKTVVDGVRAAITAAHLPPGLQAHAAGDLAIQVDQQKASGNTGNKVQFLSILFVIVLLVLIFRSLSLAITTVLPPAISVAIAGPLVAEAAKHGLQVSPIAQLLLIVLVIGAGTDYGLFLVFRVREELRGGQHDSSGENFPGAASAGRSMLADLVHPRQPARDAIVRSVTRVGESISASALTVIAAVLTLLLASFSFYSDLAWPFAIAVVVILLAGLSLLPALLSIRLSLLAVKRTLFRSWFGRPKLLPWSIQGSGGIGVWGRVAGRIVQHPGPTLLAGVVFFGGLSFAVLGYTAAGFGGNTSPPAGSDSAAGTALLAKHFPQSAANPTTLIFKFGTPVCSDPAPLAKATSELRASGLFTQVTGPLNPVGGITLTPAQYAGLCGALGPAGKLPATPPAAALDHGRIPAEAYQLYRVTGNYVSPDGRTVQFSTGLKAGDPGSTPALNAIPAIRAETASVQKSVGAVASGVGGEAPALYDISKISTSDLVHIIPVAIIAIGILLALVLRSLVAPLYLIASVGVSYLAALGLSVIVFIKIGGSGGLVFFMPFLMFIFLLALGEDYNILVMTRIREEAHRLPLRQAVAKAVGVTGTTVTSAGLVLAGSFIVLTVAAGSGSGASQVRDIGLGLALGILMDTFLVRTLLVPSTVVLLGRWNWWPSKLTVDEPGELPVESPGTPAAVPGDLT